MSRTDKTQPFQVRLWDGTLHRVPVHDHVNGVCDLPASLAEALAQYDGGGIRPAGSCFWAFQYAGIRTCACWLCRDSKGLRAMRRAERQRLRRELLEFRKLSRAGALDD